jgi:hypothetical protein
LVPGIPSDALRDVVEASVGFSPEPSWSRAKVGALVMDVSADWLVELVLDGTNLSSYLSALFASKYFKLTSLPLAPSLPFSFSREKEYSPLLAMEAMSIFGMPSRREAIASVSPPFLGEVEVFPMKGLELIVSQVFKEQG